MPHTSHPQIEAQALLREWLRHVHEAARVVDRHTTREDIRVAQERLAVHQEYVIQLIAVGLESGTVLF
jgi:hypothetical protein